MKWFLFFCLLWSLLSCVEIIDSDTYRVDDHGKVPFCREKSQSEKNQEPRVSCVRVKSLLRDKYESSG